MGRVISEDLTLRVNSNPDGDDLRNLLDNGGEFGSLWRSSFSIDFMRIQR